MSSAAGGGDEFYLQVVTLKRDVHSRAHPGETEEVNLPAGARGTVVEVYRAGAGYEVEFTGDDGRTIALITLRPEDIQLAADS